MNEVLFNGEPVFPSKVVCIGRNYVAHIRELGNDTPTEPVLFIKPNSAISQTLRTHDDFHTHYEGEIVLCMCAGEIAGVGFGLDLTRREVQSRLKDKGLPWERAKAFDGAAVFSHFVPFLGDVSVLRLELTINDVLMQTGGCELMIYPPAKIVDEVKALFTLEEHDLIMTGTPEGVGELVRGDVFSGRVYAADSLLVESRWEVA